MGVSIMVIPEYIVKNLTEMDKLNKIQNILKLSVKKTQPYSETTVVVNTLCILKLVYKGIMDMLVVK